MQCSSPVTRYLQKLGNKLKHKNNTWHSPRSFVAKFPKQSHHLDKVQYLEGILDKPYNALKSLLDKNAYSQIDLTKLFAVVGAWGSISIRTLAQELFRLTGYIKHCTLDMYIGIRELVQFRKESEVAENFKSIQKSGKISDIMWSYNPNVKSESMAADDPPNTLTILRAMKLTIYYRDRKY